MDEGKTLSQQDEYWLFMRTVFVTADAAFEGVSDFLSELTHLITHFIIPN